MPYPLRREGPLMSEYEYMNPRGRAESASPAVPISPAPHVQGPPPGWLPPAALPPQARPVAPKRRGQVAILAVVGALVLGGMVVLGVVLTGGAGRPGAAASPSPSWKSVFDGQGPAGETTAAVGPEAAFLEAVEPLGITNVPDSKMIELGQAMCEVLDQSSGDVGQLVNVKSDLPKSSILIIAKAAGRYLCPQWMTNTQDYTLAVEPTKPAAPATPTIEDGTWTVGEDIPAGTYKTTGSGDDCYWAILKSGTNGDDIVNNHIGGGNLRVTLKKGQDFETERCGTWTKVK